MSDSPIEDIVIKEYTSHQTDEFIKVLEESEKGTVYSWIEPIIFEEQKTKFAFIYENKVHLYDRKQESINENDELNNAMTNIFKKIEEKKHISYTGRVEIKPEEKLVYLIHEVPNNGFGVVNYDPNKSHDEWLENLQEKAPLTNEIIYAEDKKMFYGINEKFVIAHIFDPKSENTYQTIKSKLESIGYQIKREPKQ